MDFHGDGVACEFLDGDYHIAHGTGFVGQGATKDPVVGNGLLLVFETSSANVKILSANVFFLGAELRPDMLEEKEDGLTC